MAVKPTPSAADYAAYQQDVDGTQRLAELDALEASANDLYSAIQALEQAELDLKRAKARVAYLSEEAIPNQMEQLGLEHYKTKTGFLVKPEEKLIGYIRKDDEPKAFRWLDENGYGGMIKSEIRVAFNRDQIEQAKELQNDLRKQYPGVTSKASIHWKTLSKWVEERMKEGKDVPAVISFDKKYQTKIKPSK